MKAKTIFILFVIFIIFLLTATFPWWNKYFKSDNKLNTAGGFNFSLFSEQTVDRFTIRKGKEDTVFIRHNNQWKVNNFDVSRQAVNDFFNNLSGLGAMELVSRNLNNHRNFEVTEEEGFALTFYTGDSGKTFIIGKQGPVFNSFYVRDKDENDVYIIYGQLRNILSRPVSYWRDKVIVKVEEGLIDKIELISKAEPFTIIKNQSGKWQMEGSGRTAVLEETIASRFFAALNPLEAADFLTENESMTFKKEGEKIVFRLSGKENEKIAEINLLKKGDEWWGQVDGMDIFYKLSAYKLSDLILSYEKVFKNK